MALSTSPTHNRIRSHLHASPHSALLSPRPTAGEASWRTRTDRRMCTELPAAAPAQARDLTTQQREATPDQSPRQDGSTIPWQVSKGAEFASCEKHPAERRSTIQWLSSWPHAPSEYRSVCKSPRRRQRNTVRWRMPHLVSPSPLRSAPGQSRAPAPTRLARLPARQASRTHTREPPPKLRNPHDLCS